MNLYLNTKDHFNTKEEFELLYDPEFKMLVTHPQPINLTQYYDTLNYISHSDSKKGLTGKLYHLVKTFNISSKVKLINSFNSSDKTILDIGAGTGDFLLRAKRDKWKVSGVEPNSIAKENALNKGLLLKTSMSELTETKFEVITLWHVLEHLPNLKEQIKTISSLLNDNGTLIIAVPNFKSYDAIKYKSFWAAFDVPRHLWHFSKESLPLLFAKHGLEVVNTKPMLFDAYYVSMLSEKYKTGKPNFFKGLYAGFLSNLKAMSSGEYSSVIYVLKKPKTDL